MNRHLSGAEGYLRSALTVADRLATENARLREALAWALGEGPDPGAWPDGVGKPTGAIPSVLFAPTDADGDDWLKSLGQTHISAARHRRHYAARRILAEVRDGR